MQRCTTGLRTVVHDSTTHLGNSSNSARIALGMLDAKEPPMATEILIVALTLGLFGLCALFVRACDRI